LVEPAPTENVIHAVQGLVQCCGRMSTRVFSSLRVPINHYPGGGLDRLTPQVPLADNSDVFMCTDADGIMICRDAAPYPARKYDSGLCLYVCRSWRRGLDRPAHISGKSAQTGKAAAGLRPAGAGGVHAVRTENAARRHPRPRVLPMRIQGAGGRAPPPARPPAHRQPPRRRRVPGAGFVDRTGLRTGPAHRHRHSTQPREHRCQQRTDPRPRTIPSPPSRSGRSLRYSETSHNASTPPTPTRSARSTRPWASPSPRTRNEHRDRKVEALVSVSSQRVSEGGVGS
jgi:hypothetical protein